LPDEGLSASEIDSLWNSTIHAVTERELNAVLQRVQPFHPSISASISCVLYLRKHQLSLQERDLMLAEDACDRIAPGTNAPDETEALGWLNLKKGLNQDAIILFKDSLRSQPDRLGSLLGKAIALERTSDFVEAEAAFSHAAVSYPNSWRVQNAAGSFYLGQGRPQAAQSRFSVASVLTPKNTTVLNNLGVASLFSGDYSSAARAWNEALLTSDIEDRGQTLVNVGASYFLMRDYISARTAFEKATRLLSDDYRVWANLADTLQALGDRTASEIAYSRALDRAVLLQENNSNDPVLMAGIASLLSALGRAGVESLIEQAINTAPDNAEVHRLVGLSYVRAGLLPSARGHIDKAISLGYPESFLKADYQFDSLYISQKELSDE